MIVGIQMGATSGCAVFDGGGILYAASEERFTRKKNDSGYPTEAIRNAVVNCGITDEKIEKIVLASQKVSPVQFLCDAGEYSIADWLKEQKEYWKPRLIEGKDVSYFDVFKEKIAQSTYKDLIDLIANESEERWAEIWNEWRVEKVSKDFGVSKDKVTIINHEFGHAAYGLYGSWFEEYEDVMAIVCDGYGDESNASIYIHTDGKLEQIARYTDFNIGRIYRYITLLLGMKPNEHEFKVMGLAPYANPYIYEKPLEVFRNAYRFENGKVVIDPKLKDNYYYFKERLDGMRFDGIAAGLQIFTEEMLKQLIVYWMQKTNKRKCVISGGVALNIKANMEIGKMDCVEDLFVTGSAGDESLCIGSIYAYLDKENRGDEICGISTMYLGETIKNSEVEKTLSEYKNNPCYIIISNPEAGEIAEYIADGYILGRAVGRMEFGARALGNRSIIADPRKQETITIINKKIKNRDFWMPFTPSILKEDEDRYLDNPKGLQYPFMSVACESTDMAKRELKAALHPADFTVRPQLVTEEMNKGYYDLIKAFKKVTGVGGVLNTSLNIHGYPIVRTAADAMEVLEKTDLDGMIFEKYLVIKSMEQTMRERG